MKLHLRYTTIFVLVISIFTFALAADTFAGKINKVKLRVSTPYPPPEQSLASTHLVAWQQMVTERTNGVIKFINFFGGSLGKASEHLDLVSTGTADIVVTYGWYTPSKLPLEDFDYIFPFGPTDPYILTRAMRQINIEFPQFAKDFEKLNVVKIFQSPGIKEVILSKKPITKYENFQGKKCKVIGRYFGRWIEALNAVPVAAPGTEVYTMLQTGVIDIALDTADLQFAYNNIEQAPNVLDPGLLTTNWIGCWINKDSLAKLNKDQQNILLRSGEELEIKAAQEINPKWETNIFDTWKKLDGYTFTTMSDADRIKWAEACPNTPAEWADEVTKLGYPGWEILKRYVEITTQYGHQWLRDWTQK